MTDYFRLTFSHALVLGIAWDLLKLLFNTIIFDKRDAVKGSTKWYISKFISHIFSLYFPNSTFSQSVYLASHGWSSLYCWFHTLNFLSNRAPIKLFHLDQFLLELNQISFIFFVLVTEILNFGQQIINSLFVLLPNLVCLLYILV